MPKIIRTDRLTGQVGSVVFVAGEGETDQQHMLDHFAAQPELYEVHEDPEPNEPPAEPDDYDALTDAELDEAYATNVGGNHTSRNGKLKALRALDSDN